MAKTDKQLDEKALVDQANGAIATAIAENEETRAIAGRKLPANMVNPKIGTIGHMCLDPQERYQPKWMQLKIVRTEENMPSRQYFCNGDREWNIVTGVWVDVPMELIACLEKAEVEVVEMNMDKAQAMLGNSVTKVVNTVPRFSTQMLPSS